MLLSTAAAQAQYSASIDFASKNRYRGTDLGDPGAVVRASLTVDSTPAFVEGTYAAVSGVWRTRGGELSNAEALLGWSRRFNTVPALSSLGSGWGWDSGVHLLHYGGASQRDFHELMLGLLAPAGSARLWWSPHYFGSSSSSLYAEIEGSLALTERWRLFAHAGVLRYGDGGDAGNAPRPPNRADGLLGASYAAGRWNWRVMRNARTTIGSHAPGIDRSAAAWVLSAGVAF